MKKLINKVKNTRYKFNPPTFFLLRPCQGAKGLALLVWVALFPL